MVRNWLDKVLFHVFARFYGVDRAQNAKGVYFCLSN